ncbi:ABC transporter G family member 37-like isoform X3 [Rosa rugosa]|uniref:ABC transporter G family member 37-like isoform X3 n=1 Tax=Rosa rugosa TaxID=74645 RepID=UPI002B414949|nr:ABC transporter G family member 37-like isoform X3 [Rosa rugosa]
MVISSMSLFHAQKTSAYISQYVLHISEMTVREALDFAARCQGIGSRAGALFSSHLMAIVIFYKTRFNLEAVTTTYIMKEVTRREKQEGIVPDSDIDTYMKAISVEGLKKSLMTDYIIKVKVGIKHNMKIFKRPQHGSLTIYLLQSTKTILI